MINKGTKDGWHIYSGWFGKSVVLVIRVRRCHVPLPCQIVAESVADVRIRITPGWEMNVRKEFICAVEEYAGAVENRIN